MERIASNLKRVVASVLLSLWAGAAMAQDARLDDLFAALRTAEGSDAAQIANKIGAEWSKSGSPAMDLLLQRGREAMEAGDSERAFMHLGALIDHAPDFAEGYNARATAFFREKRFGLALADIQMTLALNPRHFGALTGLAVILEDIGLEVQALEAWRAVTRLYPASPQAEHSVPQLERKVEGSAL